MVGADLLREEIEKAPPLPEDKFSGRCFLIHQKKDHSIYVKNLISHKGNQSVLPELPLQVQVFETAGSSQYMDVVEDLNQIFKYSIKQ